MGKQLKSIEFVFENCDALSIPKNCLGYVYIDGIKSQIKRIAANSISKVQIASEIVLEIFNEGNIPYSEFDQNNLEILKFQRLQDYKDITPLNITFSDGTTEQYLVDYDEKDPSMENKNESVYLSELGNLYIIIKENGKLEDYFETTMLNDEKTINFRKKMFSIGIEEEPVHYFSRNNLSDMYRYVYLQVGDNEENLHRSALAVRVFDNDSGWKFIYEDKDRDKIPIPDTWQYPTTDIDKFVNGQKKGFSMKEILEKYPIPDEKPEEVDDEWHKNHVSKYYEEAKKQIEIAKEKYF